MTFWKTMQKIQASAFCSLLFIGLGNTQDKAKLTGISLGIGNWRTVSESVTDDYNDYGTWPSLGLYGGLGNWSAGIQLPVRSSFGKTYHKTRWALGDGQLSVGRKWESLTPRILLKVPMYDWSVENATTNEFFIGSGTIDAGFGLGYKIPTNSFSKCWTVGMDVELTTVLVNGLADYGTTHGVGSIFTEHALTSRLKIGASTLFYWDYFKWIPSYWDADTENKFSIVPGVNVGFRVGNATYLNIKGGASVFDRNQVTDAFLGAPNQHSIYFSGSVYQGF